MVRRGGCVLMLVLALLAGAMAQDNEKKTSADAAKAFEKAAWSFYKLDFVVKEVDGAKTLNSRNYTLTQRVGDWGQLRVGSRLPISDGKGGFQYVDIGLNLDSRVQEREEVLAYDWRLELSSVATEGTGNSPPVVRNVRSNGQTVLAANKTVTMTSVDDLNSTHKFVFEVTATKLK